MLILNSPGRLVGCVAHVTSDESGGPPSVGERRGRAGRGSGNLEFWNPGNLRGCGARQVFRFSGFQVFTCLGSLKPVIRLRDRCSLVV